MANALFERGREGFLDGSLDWDTNNFSAALIDLGTASAGNILISSSTAATPPVITTATHNLTTGDIVVISGHATNLTCNGMYKITVISGTTFSLQTLAGVNVTAGGGAGGATGSVVVLGGASASTAKFYSDWVAGIVGTKVGPALGIAGSPTVTDGVADANDVTFTAVSGNSVEAVVIFQDTGTNSTSRMVAFIDGQHTVKCAKTTTGTSIPVDPLTAAIPNGTVLRFSTNETATLTALANAGDRTITVSSTTVTVEAVAPSVATGSGLPVTPNGGNIIVSWDNGANRIFKL